jgi:hypothetical protein
MGEIESNSRLSSVEKVVENHAGEREKRKPSKSDPFSRKTSSASVRELENCSVKKGKPLKNVKKNLWYWFSEPQKAPLKTICS